MGCTALIRNCIHSDGRFGAVGNSIGLERRRAFYAVGRFRRIWAGGLSSFCVLIDKSFWRHTTHLLSHRERS